jgi:hypothetical protein
MPKASWVMLGTAVAGVIFALGVLAGYTLGAGC